MDNRSTRVFVSHLAPDFSCYLRGRLYPHSTHEMLPTCSFRQVKYFRKIVLTILYISLLTCPTLAFPKPKTKIKEEGDKSVTIQVSGCRQQSNEELRRMMGPAFDDSKMAYDDVIDDDITGSKRNSRKQSVIDRDSESEDFVDEEDDFLDEEEELEELIDPKTTESSEKGAVSVQNRNFMRRKRDTLHNDNTNNLSDRQFLYQNMLYDAVSRRKSRVKRSDFSNHHPLTWECRKKNKWMKMKEGYFPSRIMEVKCKQKDCFFGMYTCNPVKYTVRVLKRDPENACNPVPLIGNATVYEEVWLFKKIRVTVACECGLSWKATKRRKKFRSRSRG